MIMDRALLLMLLGLLPLLSGTKDYVTKRYMDFFNAFATFVDKVEEIKPDVCFIAGDIFDKKEINPDILSKTEYLFKRLKDNVKKDIIAIEGNHDNSRILEESWLEYLQEQNILKVFYYNKDFEEKNYLKIDATQIGRASCRERV